MYFRRSVEQLLGKYVFKRNVRQMGFCAPSAPHPPSPKPLFLNLWGLPLIFFSKHFRVSIYGSALQLTKCISFCYCVSEILFMVVKGVNVSVTTSPLYYPNYCQSIRLFNPVHLQSRRIFRASEITLIKC